MRLFLALRFDSQMNKALTSTLHDLKVAGVKGNYAPAQNLHITLVFLGETDRASEIKNLIGAIPVPAMRIGFDKFAMYGNILTVEVKGNQKLKNYAASVRAALDSAGIDYDHKKFSPHVTLVRKANGSFKGVQIPKGAVTLSHVSLMKSVQKDGKRIYTEIAGWG